MASEPTLEELLDGVPAGVLNERLRDDSKLAEIAGGIVRWTELVNFLGLTEVDQDDIEGNNKTAQTQK